MFTLDAHKSVQVITSLLRDKIRFHVGVPKSYSVLVKDVVTAVVSSFKAEEKRGEREREKKRVYNPFEKIEYDQGACTHLKGSSIVKKIYMCI